MRTRAPTALAYGVTMVAAAFAPLEIFAFVVAVVGGLAIAEALRLIPASARWTDRAAALLYFALGLIALVSLRALGTEWVLVALFTVWAADVASYLVGSRWGRTRIAPRLSPGKTREGTLAGFVAAGLVLFAMWIWAQGPALPLPLVALLVGPAAFGGDLIESALKRSAGVKDSGTLLPGHGGVLDRIDSLLLVSPVVAIAARLG